MNRSYVCHNLYTSVLIYLSLIMFPRYISAEGLCVEGWWVLVRVIRGGWYGGAGEDGWTGAHKLLIRCTVMRKVDTPAWDGTDINLLIFHVFFLLPFFFFTLFCFVISLQLAFSCPSLFFFLFSSIFIIVSLFLCSFSSLILRIHLHFS